MMRYVYAALFGNGVIVAGVVLVLWLVGWQTNLAEFPLFLLGWTLNAMFWSWLGLAVVLPPPVRSGPEHNHDPYACDFACPLWPHHGTYCTCGKCAP